MPTQPHAEMPDLEHSGDDEATSAEPALAAPTAIDDTDDGADADPAEIDASAAATNTHEPVMTHEFDDVDDESAEDGPVPVSASAHVNAGSYAAGTPEQPSVSGSARHPYAGTPASDGSAASNGTASAPARPRIRSGAIVWGVLVMAFAAATGAIAAFAPVRYAFGAWAASLTLSGLLVIGVVAVGALVLLIAGLSAIRSVQRRAVQH